MNLIKIENGSAVLDPKTVSKIVEFERMIKDLKEAEEELKNGIMEEMERKNIIKLETDELVINYIAPTDRETFDSKSFRKDHADLYDEYIRMTRVKPSVRIKLR